MSLNIENVNYNDFINICRICLTNCDIKFTQDGVISNVYYKLTDIQFETNDDLPQQICWKCFEKINEIHEFALQCKQTHNVLLKCLKKITNTGLINEINEQVELEEKITIDEFKIDFIAEEKVNLKEGIKNENMNLRNENIFKIESDQSNTNVGNASKSDLNGDYSIMVSCSLDENTNSSIPNAENNKEIYNENPEKIFKCDVCNKTYKYPSLLVLHARTHSGERPYKCAACSKTFTRSSHLKEHVRTHSGERPYKCQLCSKSYIQWNHLKRHIKMHSDERPFKCEHCSKSFTQFDSLKIHIISHNNERPHTCEQCNKSFSVLNHLKEHMRTHSGERPYKCAQCEKSFIQSQHLKRHMRTHIN